MILEYCKLQIGCMLILLYVAFIYWQESGRFRQQRKFTIFDGLLLIGLTEIFLDGLTAYTVNHLESVNGVVNRVLHMLFLLSLDSFIFLIFIYMISITTGIPRNGKIVALCIPFLLNVVLVIISIPELRYCEGELSNYSMGGSVYTCFVMVGVYILLSLITFFGRWRYIEKHKRVNVFTYLFIMVCVTIYQMFHPQALVTSICITVIILGVYLNQENPTVKELAHYHDEMITGFATLVENKDGSTGGHIKRTTMYVRLLAEELQRRGYCKDMLTKDYMRNLCLAAPMHDVGKIAIPDVILQKPGKLTQEEFEIMKTHTVCGGKIIQETFGHLDNGQYEQMAYQVARYHHEKWNGKGYPEGLKENEIPLSARIMAIADVFDAVSEKRCYRDAMPLDKCFQIIREGSGQDFDPMLAEVFLDIRDAVEKVHCESNQGM